MLLPNEESDPDKICCVSLLDKIGNISGDQTPCLLLLYALLKNVVYSQPYNQPQNFIARY